MKQILTRCSYYPWISLFSKKMKDFTESLGIEFFLWFFFKRRFFFSWRSKQGNSLRTSHLSRKDLYWDLPRDGNAVSTFWNVGILLYMDLIASDLPKHKRHHLLSMLGDPSGFLHTYYQSPNSFWFAEHFTALITIWNDIDSMCSVTLNLLHWNTSSIRQSPCLSYSPFHLRYSKIILF